MERPLTNVTSVPHASALSRLQWSCPLYNQGQDTEVVKSGEEERCLFKDEERTKIGSLDDWSALLDEISVDFSETEKRVNCDNKHTKNSPAQPENEQREYKTIAKDDD